jgi:hypothetical protein
MNLPEGDKIAMCFFSIVTLSALMPATENITK